MVSARALSPPRSPPGAGPARPHAPHAALRATGSRPRARRRGGAARGLAAAASGGGAGGGGRGGGAAARSAWAAAQPRAAPRGSGLRRDRGARKGGSIPTGAGSPPTSTGPTVSRIRSGVHPDAAARYLPAPSSQELRGLQEAGPRAPGPPQEQRAAVLAALAGGGAGAYLGLLAEGRLQWSAGAYTAAAQMLLAPRAGGLRQQVSRAPARLAPAGQRSGGSRTARHGRTPRGALRSRPCPCAFPATGGPAGGAPAGVRRASLDRGSHGGRRPWRRQRSAARAHAGPAALLPAGAARAAGAGGAAGGGGRRGGWRRGGRLAGAARPGRPAG
jgi:hypothetical protein